MAHKLPVINIAALFRADHGARDRVDAEIAKAAQFEGMLTLTGLPEWAIATPERRRDLLRIFSLHQKEIRQLWRWNFDPARPNVYRGWFPLQNGTATYKEGIDFGPDLAFGAQVVDRSDPLREASPLPLESSLPGWHAAARDYYLAMLRLSKALMHSIARGLQLPEDVFDPAFERSISTLRLLHYPVRPPESLSGVESNEIWTGEGTDKQYLLARGHVDTGFLTLLAQDGVPGLQAQHHDGTWLDVEPLEGSLAMNFGKVLQTWTAGRIKATKHRVVGLGQPRHSIPFFYEAAVDAVIAPLPLDGAEAFDPFYFGDYLWETTTKFVEQKGIAHLRQPRGRPATAH